MNESLKFKGGCVDCIGIQRAIKSTVARTLLLLLLCLPASALTFTQAPTFAGTNAHVTSTNWNKLMDAYRDRINSGVGDPLWRTWWAAYSLTRNILNPADDTSFFAADIWWEKLMHIDPAKVANTWDVSSPGTWAGVNTVNPLMMFVYGIGYSSNAVIVTNIYKERRCFTNAAHVVTCWTNEISVLDTNWQFSGWQDEPTRLRAITNIPSGLTANQYWSAAKIQRGCVDSTGTNFGTGSFEYVARQWRGMRLVTADANGNVFNSTWGGDLPALGASCNFTALRTNAGLSDLSYPSDAVVLLGSSHYIVIASGTTNWLRYEDYLFGPHYGGGACLQMGNQPISGTAGSVGGWGTPPTCSQAPGRLMDFMLQLYANEYRGSTAQRAIETRRISTIAFDFQKFLTNQFRLAPAYGVLSGTNMTAAYPALTLTTNAPTLPTNSHAGFVLAAVRVWTTNGTASVTISNTMATNALWWLPAGTNAVVTWLDGWMLTNTVARLSAGTNAVFLEFAELQRALPTFEDAYACLRMASSGTAGANCDAPGWAVTSPIGFSASYFAHGCIVGTNAVETVGAPTTSPVYESVRSTLRRNMRFFKRGQFTGATLGATNSVLTFARHISVDTDLGALSCDAWDGIAPALEAQTNLLANTRYVLSNAAAITISGPATNRVTNSVTVGTIFTVGVGCSLVTTGGVVWQYDGIRHIAPQNGLDNEWVLFLSSNCYTANGSVMDDDQYGDMLPFLHNRCWFLSTVLKDINYADLRWMFDPDARSYRYRISDPVLVAEAPSAFDYARLRNLGNADFYNSCEVFPQPYPVTSVTYTASNDTVSVTLGTPLKASVNGERTDANIISDYLTRLAGTNCPARTGDAAVANEGGNFDLGTVLHGSCEPRFYFTRLPGKAWVDQPADNSVQDPLDTRVFSEQILWLNFLLASMCEGYVDLFIGNGSDCTPACFTFEDLCFFTSGSRWFDMIPPTNSWDRSQSFGPFANTKLYMEYLDRISRGVNALTEAVIPVVGMTFEQQQKVYFGMKPAALDESCKPAYVLNPGICNWSNTGWGAGYGVTNCMSGQWITNAGIGIYCAFPSVAAEAAIYNQPGGDLASIADGTAADLTYWRLIMILPGASPAPYYDPLGNHAITNWQNADAARSSYSTDSGTLNWIIPGCDTNSDRAGDVYCSYGGYGGNGFATRGGIMLQYNGNSPGYGAPIGDSIARPLIGCTKTEAWLRIKNTDSGWLSALRPELQSMASSNFILTAIAYDYYTWWTNTGTHYAGYGAGTAQWWTNCGAAAVCTLMSSYTVTNCTLIGTTSIAADGSMAWKVNPPAPHDSFMASVAGGSGVYPTLTGPSVQRTVNPNNAYLTLQIPLTP